MSFSSLEKVTLNIAFWRSFIIKFNTVQAFLSGKGQELLSFGHFVFKLTIGAGDYQSYFRQQNEFRASNF